MRAIRLSPGWRALEEHLVRHHAMDQDAVEAMDSHTLRITHKACHLHGRYAGEAHRHVG